MVCSDILLHLRHGGPLCILAGCLRGDGRPNLKPAGPNSETASAVEGLAEKGCPAKLLACEQC